VDGDCIRQRLQPAMTGSSLVRNGFLEAAVRDNLCATVPYGRWYQEPNLPPIDIPAPDTCYSDSDVYGEQAPQ
jgi:hypothetical protein